MAAGGRPAVAAHGGGRTVDEYGPLVDVPGVGGAVSVYARRPLTLDGLLRRAAQRWPDRPALEAPAGVFRYSEFDAAVTAAAAGLRDAGVRPGDRVAVALSHDALLSAVPFVASRVGCSALLLNTALPAVQWARQLAAVQPAVCVADASHLDRMRAAAPRVRLVTAPDDVSLDPASAADDPALEVCENAPVVLLATSGTTAEPKVIPLTNRGLIHAGLA
ncbi:MAG: acyl--CoA ligase, partial [Euzebyaceae bacterium]|nr:acyl--CoA ligase [Euzebyaceae bacterium]